MPMKCFLLYRPTMFPKCSIRSNGFYWFHYFVVKDKSNGRFMHTSIRVSAETCRTSPPYLMDCYNLKLTTLSCDNVSYRPQQLLREGNVFTIVCHSFCPHGGDLHPGEICLGGLPRWWSASGVGGGRLPYWILRDMVNERAVRILLECILVEFDCTATPMPINLCWYYSWSKKKFND